MEWVTCYDPAYDSTPMLLTGFISGFLSNM